MVCSCRTQYLQNSQTSEDIKTIHSALNLGVVDFCYARMSSTIFVYSHVRGDEATEAQKEERQKKTYCCAAASCKCQIAFGMVVSTKRGARFRMSCSLLNAHWQQLSHTRMLCWRERARRRKKHKHFLQFSFGSRTHAYACSVIGTEWKKIIAKQISSVWWWLVCATRISLFACHRFGGKFNKFAEHLSVRLFVANGSDGSNC